MWIVPQRSENTEIRKNHIPDFSLEETTGQPKFCFCYQQILYSQIWEDGCMCSVFKCMFVWSRIYFEPSHSELLKVLDHELLHA